MTNSKRYASVKNFIWGLFILNIVGGLLSSYSIFHHMKVMQTGHSKAFCNMGQTVNCDAVVKSPYSEFLGTPLGVWSLGYHLGILLILLLAIRFKNSLHHLMQAIPIATLSALLVSIGLGAISILVLNKICLTCTGLYIINILNFLAVLYYFSWFKPFQLHGLLKGIIIMFFPLIITMMGFHLSHKSNSQLSSKTLSHHSPSLPLLDLEKKEIPITQTPYGNKGEDYRQGSENPLLTIVEFADFECPACASMSLHLKKLLQEFKGKIQIVFRNYPLDQSCNPNITRKFHQYACQIAKVARCAGKYGKFWQYHNKAFESQKMLSEKSAIQWGLDINLTKIQINDCLNDRSILDKIKDDIREGNRLGVRGTPTVFINGYKYVGHRERIGQAIREQLSRL